MPDKLEPMVMLMPRKKKMGRPRKTPSGLSESVPMRVAPEVYAALDKYRKQNQFNPRNMSDAARELLVEALAAKGFLTESRPAK